MSERRGVVVVGGGIAGLAAAHRLAGVPGAADRTGTAGPQITLLEADDRPDAKIRTEVSAGPPLGVGAEALLARVGVGLELCHEMGRQHDLLAPASDQTYVW